MLDDPYSEPSGSDVIRSVFDGRVDDAEVEAALDIVRISLTKGEKPVQGREISSSSSPFPNNHNRQNAGVFWFLFSPTGEIQHLSSEAHQVLRLSDSNHRPLSVFSLVAKRDESIVLDMIRFGPMTKASCRLLFNSEKTPIPFDIDFAKLSSHQVACSTTDFSISGIFCVASPVKKVCSMDSPEENRSLMGLPISGAPSVSQAHFKIDKTDEFQDELSNSSTQTPGYGNDTLSRLCFSLFADEAVSTDNTSNENIICVPISEPWSCGVMTNEGPPVTKKERTRKCRAKKESEEKNVVLKSLLAPKSTEAIGRPQNMKNADRVMFAGHAPSMAQQPHSYMGSQMCGGEYLPQTMGPQGMGPQIQHAPWNEINSHYQHPQVQQFASSNSTKGTKRKHSANDRNKMNFPTQQNPFQYQQAGPMMDNVAVPMPSEEYQMAPMGAHLSPYRYTTTTPTTTGYWPGGARPPSRSELVRMELRNSLHARQIANQQRASLTPQMDISSQQQTAFGADSLGFDLDVAKDCESLESDLEMFDFNIVGGGCGFDMDNENTKVLVMKLLS